VRSWGRSQEKSESKETIDFDFLKKHGFI